MASARTSVAGTSCSPSTPSALEPGVPYRAMYFLPGTPGTCGNTSCPPPASSTPVAAAATRPASRSGGPNAAPNARTWSGAAAAIACTPGVVARGSPPGASRTGRPRRARSRTRPRVHADPRERDGAGERRRRGRVRWQHRGDGVATEGGRRGTLCQEHGRPRRDERPDGRGLLPAATGVGAPNGTPVTARRTAASAPAATGTTAAPTAAASPRRPPARPRRRAASARRAPAPGRPRRRSAAPERREPRAADAAVSCAATSVDRRDDDHRSGHEHRARRLERGVLRRRGRQDRRGLGRGGDLRGDRRGRRRRGRGARRRTGWASTAPPSSVQPASASTRDERQRAGRASSASSARHPPSGRDRRTAYEGPPADRASLAARRRARFGDDKPPGSAGALRVRPDTTSHPQTRGT